MFDPGLQDRMLILVCEPFERDDRLARDFADVRLAGTTAAPSMWTVQAPHCATPQPYLGLVIPSSSRNTQSKGISGTTSTWCLIPLTVSSIMSTSPVADVVVVTFQSSFNPSKVT